MSSSDPSKAVLMQRIMVKALVTSNIIQSVGKAWWKERCGLEPGTDFIFRLRNRQKLLRIRFGNIWYFNLFIEMRIEYYSFSYYNSFIVLIPFCVVYCIKVPNLNLQGCL